MRKIIVWVVVAALAVALAWWVAGLPGSVTVGLYGYTVTLATSLALVGVVVIVLALLVVLRVLGWVFGTPRRLRARRARRRREAGDRAVTRTLVALAAGEDGHARREAMRARRLLGDTPQTLLLAAEAGRLAQREDEATGLYKQLAARDDAALLGLRGLFRQAVTRESWEEAAAIARRAEAVHPGGAWLREERAQLAVRTGNWAQALRLARARRAARRLRHRRGRGGGGPGDGAAAGQAGVAGQPRLRARRADLRETAARRRARGARGAGDPRSVARRADARSGRLRAGPDRGPDGAHARGRPHRRDPAGASREPPAARPRVAGGRADRRGAPAPARRRGRPG